MVQVYRHDQGWGYVCLLFKTAQLFVPQNGKVVCHNKQVYLFGVQNSTLNLFVPYSGKHVSENNLGHILSFL